MNPSNKYYLLLLCIFSIALVSCNKEPTTGGVTVPRIKTVTQGDLTDTYFYDEMGRINKRVSTSGERRSALYSYTDSNIVISFFSATDQFIGSETYKLNSNGLATEWTTTFGSVRMTYSYTLAKQLSESHHSSIVPGQPDMLTDFYYHYTNNNLDSINISFTGDTDNTPTDTASLLYDEYYTDKINTIGNENFGWSFLGKSSKNLVKTARQTDSAGNEYTIAYTYNYDTHNRIIEEIVTRQNPGLTTVRKFTYY